MATTNEQSIVYAQLGLGFVSNPLRTSDITHAATLGSSAEVISSQLSTYMSGGFEFFDHLTLGFTLPIARLYGKWKMSQNRLPADSAGAAEGLSRDGNTTVAAIVWLAALPVDPC